MKDRRREVDSWLVRGDIEKGQTQDLTIEPGTWADTVLEYMPNTLFMCKPIVVGKDGDGLVVEWCYKDVIFTLARVRGAFAGIGPIEVYAVQKIEEITSKEEVEDV